MTNTREKKSEGFTLIEMLVVMAIIALLISLIFGGVSKARDKVYVVRTLTNLRELHAANVQHSLKYEGYYVPHRLFKAEDSDNPDTFWLDNNHFAEFIYKEGHNGWDDWPSYFKTGSPNANTLHNVPKGVKSKMSIAISLGAYRNHWHEGAFTLYQLAPYPRMIMFADSASWLIHGMFVDGSPKKYKENAGAAHGQMAFRYNQRAGMVTVSGNAVMVRYEDVLPMSDYPEMWPDIRPQAFDLYDR